jgi:homoserine dehydrogenase
MRVSYRYEAAVADGLPVFNLIRYALPAAGIIGLCGVLNSTTTVVLDALARGETIDAGIRHAQLLGITEADLARPHATGHRLRAARRRPRTRRSTGLRRPAS